MGKFLITWSDSGVKFDLKAENGRIIVSSQLYRKKKYCLKGIESIIKNAPAAPLEDQTIPGYEVIRCPKFELYREQNKGYRFRLRAKNGQIIAASAGHLKKNGCLKGIESVRRNSKGSVIEDADRAGFDF